MSEWHDEMSRRHAEAAVPASGSHVWFGRPGLEPAVPAELAAVGQQWPPARPEWLQRLMDEQRDLSLRLGKLRQFLQDGAPGASERQRYLMQRQQNHMADLLAVLDLRLQDLGVRV